MAHIFDGDWRSLIVQNGSPKNDDVFHLEVDPTSFKLVNSTHNGKGIEGQAGRGKVFDHIIIREAGPPKVVYKGILLVNGATSVISGLQNLNPNIAFELESEGNLTEKELLNFFEQEQEIWIATKP
jgi:hypothetical protein